MLTTRVVINDKLSIDSCIDSGAAKSVLSWDIYKKLQNTGDLISSRARVQGIGKEDDNNPCKVKGKIILKLAFDNCTQPLMQEFAVVENLRPPILVGNDFMKTFKAVLDCDEGTMMMKHPVVQGTKLKLTENYTKNQGNYVINAAEVEEKEEIIYLNSNWLMKSERTKEKPVEYNVRVHNRYGTLNNEELNDDHHHYEREVQNDASRVNNQAIKDRPAGGHNGHLEMLSRGNTTREIGQDKMSQSTQTSPESEEGLIQKSEPKKIEQTSQSTQTETREKVTWKPEVTSQSTQTSVELTKEPTWSNELRRRGKMERMYEWMDENDIELTMEDIENLKKAMGRVRQNKKEFHAKRRKREEEEKKAKEEEENKVKKSEKTKEEEEKQKAKESEEKRTKYLQMDSRGRKKILNPEDITDKLTLFYECEIQPYSCDLGDYQEKQKIYAKEELVDEWLLYGMETLADYPACKRGKEIIEYEQILEEYIAKEHPEKIGVKKKIPERTFTSFWENRETPKLKEKAPDTEIEKIKEFTPEKPKEKRKNETHRNEGEKSNKKTNKEICYEYVYHSCG